MMFLLLSDHVMILAAGFGTRLMPLTQNTPKPLLPIHDKKLLDIHLDTIKDLGFTNAVVNTHYLSDQIKKHLSEKKFGISSHEEVILDSGGGILKALPFFNKPFLCINADAYTSGDYKKILKKMMDSFDPTRMKALLLLSPLSHNRGYHGLGDFDCDSEKKIDFSSEKKPFVYNGIQILSPDLFSEKPGSSFSVKEIWDNAYHENKLYGFIDDQSLWFDTGTHEGYKDANGHHYF